jgi:hypothetical protein
LFLVGCDQSPPETVARLACQLASAPDFAVGGLEAPDHVFGEVVDATLLPDGRIAVVDRQARSVSLFSADGELLRTIGREGEGPGEFLDPIAVDHRGDTLAVWDWRQNRITLASLSDDRVETIRVDGLLNATHHLGFHEDGFVVGSVLAREIPATGLGTNTLRVVVVDSRGVARDTLARVTASRSGWVDQASRFAGSPTFGPRGSFTSAPGGIYWTAGDSAVIYRVRRDETVRLVWDWPERVVSGDELERYRASRLEGVPGQMRQTIERQYEVMPVAEVFPVALDVMPDMDGGVWVEIYPIPSDSLSTWLRVTPDGVACHLQLSAEFEIAEGGADWILAYDEDELGVQAVSLWSLEGAQ